MSYKDTAQLKSLVLAQKVEMGEGGESHVALVLYICVHMYVKEQVHQSPQFLLHPMSCHVSALLIDVFLHATYGVLVVWMA